MKPLSQSLLKELLSYDPDTGLFTWLVSPASHRVKAGDIAKSKDRYGYIRIKLQGKTYMAHRLAWFFVYGEFPTLEMDHKNCIKNDNRLSNLRLATRSENMLNRGIKSNNKSGFKGVIWNKLNSNWIARGCVNRVRNHLGCFDTAEEASIAYQQFAASKHGEFYRDTTTKD